VRARLHACMRGRACCCAEHASQHQDVRFLTTLLLHRGPRKTWMQAAARGVPHHGRRHVGG
jgi:hypothetical protein